MAMGVERDEGWMGRMKSWRDQHTRAFVSLSMLTMRHGVRTARTT